ncbi:STAS domain-containing protein [Mycolicibacterium pulveris]|uniref:STAS domain-containing protein n=1 Tax=Mycolicibacterium pulveris TaxID=36813 RepID=UPI003CFAC1F2
MIAVASDPVCRLTVATKVAGRTSILTVGGVLDSTTYRSLRDTIIKAALDQPEAVIVDITELTVPAESALAVFTSARWHVGRWPEVPIVLVCRHSRGRNTVHRNGVARYLPVFATVESALADLSRHGSPRYRQRARAQLPAKVASLKRARDLAREWLTAWSQAESIPVAKVIVTALVENVLAHTETSPDIRMETDGKTVTVAVTDGDPAPAVFREDAGINGVPTGLRIVAALSRAWGNAPTPSGKTVWAVIAPENRL